MSACSESSRAEGAGAGTAVMGLRSTKGAGWFIAEEEAIPGWSWIPSGEGALREVLSHASFGAAACPVGCAAHRGNPSRSRI